MQGEGEEAGSENEGKEIGFPKGVAHIILVYRFHVRISCMFNTVFMFPFSFPYFHIFNFLFQIRLKSINQGSFGLLRMKNEENSGVRAQQRTHDPVFATM